MLIEFRNNETYRLCTDIKYAKRKLNVEAAYKLHSAINFIESTCAFSDIVNYPPFHFHRLAGDRKNEYSIDVGRRLGYRIIIDPLDENGVSAAGKIIEEIKECTKTVLVLEVTNHYG